MDLPPQTVPADMLRPDSPFGINTNLGPNTGDLDQRLEAFQQAGIKWGRQNFGWDAIERQPGQYDFSAYDPFVDDRLKHGLMIFGQLGAASTTRGRPREQPPTPPAPPWPSTTPARWTTGRFWNEPNGGF